MASAIDEFEVLDIEPPKQLLKPLPILDGKPIPLFFGRRFLTYRDLIEIGFINNAMTLRRLIAEGRFPPPLALGRQIRLWDALELQGLVDRLAAERPRSGRLTSKHTREIVADRRRSGQP